ncbi:MAG TPA: hypothetical protein PKW66_28065, partial [Polyangiaceae bacterium]|nr:hypothetical protein [Polyangiaceae bacterium]
PVGLTTASLRSTPPPDATRPSLVDDLVETAVFAVTHEFFESGFVLKGSLWTVDESAPIRPER